MKFDIIKSKDTTVHRGYSGEFIDMLPAIDAVRDIRVGPPILNPPAFRDGSQAPWRGDDVIIATDTSNAIAAFYPFMVKADQCNVLFALQPRSLSTYTVLLYVLCVCHCTVGRPLTI